MSLDTFPQSSGGEPGTIAVSAERPGPAGSEQLRGTRTADLRPGLTRVPSYLLPGLLGEDVQQQRGDERREGPEPDGAVSAAARHGERTVLMTRQAFTDQRD